MANSSPAAWFHPSQTSGLWRAWPYFYAESAQFTGLLDPYGQDETGGGDHLAAIVKGRVCPEAARRSARVSPRDAPSAAGDRGVAGVPSLGCVWVVVCVDAW